MSKSTLLAVLLALGAVGFFVLSLSAKPSDNASLVLQSTTIDLGNVQPASVHEITTVFQNPGGSAATILGAENVCGGNGCAATKGLPLQVIAGSKVSVITEFKVPNKPGAFNYELKFYTGYGPWSHLTCQVRGVVVDTPTATTKPTN